MTTAISPAVTLDSHDPPVSCLLCGAAIVMHEDFDVCGACGSRRVRPQPKAAATGLLPCPYCLSTDLEWDTGAITCQDCGACGPQHETSRIGTLWWNKRNDPSLRIGGVPTTQPSAATDPYTCPVCFAGMDQPPEDHAICGGCGTHFGYDDSGRSHAELRALWIAHGRQWHYLRAAIEREKQAAAAATSLDAVQTIVAEVLNGIQEEWIDQRVTEILQEDGRIWPQVEDEIKADVSKRMTTFRTYITSKLNKAAASRDASLTAYVDDLLDVLQDVGGMSAAWCETKLETFEALLREG